MKKVYKFKDLIVLKNRSLMINFGNLKGFELLVQFTIFKS